MMPASSTFKTTPKSNAVGLRIRARRTALDLSQAELARRAEISAAYLNLIEHDRRRIGGKLLNRLAELLDMPAAELGATAPDRIAMRLAGSWAKLHPERDPAQSAEEFSLGLPDWAAFCAAALERAEEASARAERLSARAQNDPALRDLLHELLTAASAVRSASAILHGAEELSPEWQARFRRNLDEDSRRLAEGAANLAEWLESNGQEGLTLPEEEVDRMLASHGYQIGGMAPNAEAVLDQAEFSSAAARALAQTWLTQLLQDAKRLPDEILAKAIADQRPDPTAIATALDRPLALVLRRLAFSPEAQRQGWGLMVVDQAGGLRLSRPAEGYTPIWSGVSCPFLPVFEALRRPYERVQCQITLPSPLGEYRFTAIAAAELVQDEHGSRAEASMLLSPSSADKGEARPAGLGCAHCPRVDCQARRSPAFLTG